MAELKKQFIATIIDVNDNTHSYEVKSTSKEELFSDIVGSLNGEDKFLYISEDKIINVNQIVTIEIVE